MVVHPGSILFATPFSDEVMNTPRPRNVKIPNLELYDGTTNPEEHLGVYKSQLYVQDVDDATQCRYFLATLEGVVEAWFSDLPLGSVTCF